MELKNIESLLEKYEEGQTSLQEEAQLKHYFTTETVAPHLEVYRSLFTYFVSDKQEGSSRTGTLPNMRSSILILPTCLKIRSLAFLAWIYKSYLIFDPI